MSMFAVVGAWSQTLVTKAGDLYIAGYNLVLAVLGAGGASVVGK